MALRVLGMSFHGMWWWEDLRPGGIRWGRLSGSPLFGGLKD